MTRTVLIDGDIPVYQSAAAVEKPIKWNDEWWMYLANENEAKSSLDGFIANIAEELKADRVVVALSDDVNFRYDVYPDYKSNRADTRPPLCRAVLKDYVKETYDCYVRPGLEGDDVLGILSTAKKAVPGEKVVVSIDKDLRTIPGLILNWNHAKFAVNSGHIGSIEDAIYEVTEEQADYFHLMQTLAGDTTDGYPGCPGVGMQTADEILQDEPHVVEQYEHTFKSGKRKGETELRWRKSYGEYTRWQTVVSYFAKAGLTEDHALAQARVARICRASDYDFKRKEVILWTP